MANFRESQAGANCGASQLMAGLFDHIWSIAEVKVISDTEISKAA
jgi:hypothetical protein